MIFYSFYTTRNKLPESLVYRVEDKTDVQVDDQGEPVTVDLPDWSPLQVNMKLFSSKEEAQKDFFKILFDNEDFRFGEYFGTEKSDKIKKADTKAQHAEVREIKDDLINKIVNARWEDAIKTVIGKSVDLVVTDPPYGMSFQSNARKEKHLEIEGDDNLDWLDGWFAELKRVCKEDAHLYIFCSWHNIEVFKSVCSRYFKLKNILVWEKKGQGLGDLEGDYAPAYELVLFCSNGKKKLNGSRDRNILRSSKALSDIHPTEKPVNLISYLIEKSSKRGDVVLDTFAGSFSTAKAAKSLGRNFYCFEIEKSYCDQAKHDMEAIGANIFETNFYMTNEDFINNQVTVEVKETIKPAVQSSFLFEEKQIDDLPFIAEKPAE